MVEARLSGNSWFRPCLRMVEALEYRLRDAECGWKMAAVCQWKGEGEQNAFRR